MSKPIDKTPDYLHFKHKYGFLANFTELYQAFFWSCQQREIEINHQKCDNFFQKYIESIGLEVEFKQAIIDPRSFTISITVGNEHLAPEARPPSKTATYKHINAGRLHEYSEHFIPLIAINGLTECSLTIEGITYNLYLED